LRYPSGHGHRSSLDRFAFIASRRRRTEGLARFADAHRRQDGLVSPRHEGQPRHEELEHEELLREGHEQEELASEGHEHEGHTHRRPKKKGHKDHQPPSKLSLMMEHASRVVTEWSGSSWSFALAAAVVIVWLITGPFFHYSDTWQLVINTGTTIVTFLMVFLIQRAQNKESLAVQLKLNEIVAALEGASNRLIDVENLDEDDLQQLHIFYKTLSRMAKSDDHLGKSHSVDEAEAKHHRKKKIQSSAAPRTAD
jgi:low affinity Fe/Cu permease